MHSNKICVYIFMLLSIVLGSCNKYKIEKIDRNEIKKQELESIKSQILSDYPEIYACDTQENAKNCFERQLNEHLGVQLKGVAVDDNEITKDTLWLTVNVSKEGELSLRPLEVSLTEEYVALYDTIQKSLKEISPIKPAFIKDVTVSCNFKLPLVIKNIE